MRDLRDLDLTKCGSLPTLLLRHLWCKKIFDEPLPEDGQGRECFDTGNCARDQQFGAILLGCMASLIITLSR